MGVQRRKPTTSRNKRTSTTNYKSGNKAPSFKRGARKGPSLANKASAFLLGANKAIRDMNALSKGTIVDRAVRRGAGKMAGRGIGSLSDFFKK